MNEPEQNQPINPDEGQEAAGAAPVSSSSPSDQSAQPEFGQYNQPEYGAMSNQYPANLQSIHVWGSRPAQAGGR